MYVRFDDRMEPSLVSFDDPEWMDYITFEGEDQPDAAGGAEGQSHLGRGSEF
jgi:hypothetical protein